jgi:hypothetical protein
MIAWVLSLMLILQPEAPWKTTYESTATTIVQKATATPIKGDSKGGAYTAVILVSLAWFESRFDPEAHNPKDPGGGSYGLYQASRVPIPDVAAQTDQALGMIRQSFKACAALPVEKRLSWYTTGGPVCVPTKESTHRMGLAMRLLKEHPVASQER